MCIFQELIVSSLDSCFFFNEYLLDWKRIDKFTFLPAFNLIIKKSWCLWLLVNDESFLPTFVKKKKWFSSETMLKVIIKAKSLPMFFSLSLLVQYDARYGVNFKIFAICSGSIVHYLMLCKPRHCSLLVRSITGWLPPYNGWNRHLYLF